MIFLISLVLLITFIFFIILTPSLKQWRKPLIGIAIGAVIYPLSLGLATAAYLIPNGILVAIFSTLGTFIAVFHSGLGYSAGLYLGIFHGGEVIGFDSNFAISLILNGVLWSIIYGLVGLAISRLSVLKKTSISVH